MSVWSWLWPWKRSTTPHEVILYTRENCHLCEEAHEVLQRVRQRFPFSFTILDVDSDPELVERFGLEVPVVTIDNQVRFRGKVNAVLLTRLVRRD